MSSIILFRSLALEELQRNEVKILYTQHSHDNSNLKPFTGVFKAPTSNKGTWFALNLKPNIIYVKTQLPVQMNSKLISPTRKINHNVFVLYRRLECGRLTTIIERR